MWLKCYKNQPFEKFCSPKDTYSRDSLLLDLWLKSYIFQHISYF